MPSSPPVVFVPPSAGSPPAAPLGVFTPAGGGGSPAAPAAIFIPAGGGGAPASPPGIFSPAFTEAGLAAMVVSGITSPPEVNVPLYYAGEKDGWPSYTDDGRSWDENLYNREVIILYRRSGAYWWVYRYSIAGLPSFSAISEVGDSPTPVGLAYGFPAQSPTPTGTPAVNLGGVTSPPAIFTPAGGGSPPAAPGAVFTPAGGGGSPAAPAAIFTPAGGGGSPVSPPAIFTPSGGGTPSAPPTIYEPGVSDYDGGSASSSFTTTIDGGDA